MKKKIIARESKENRNLVLQRIKKRCENILDKKINQPPLVIYPEGK